MIKGAFLVFRYARPAKALRKSLAALCIEEDGSELEFELPDPYWQQRRSKLFRPFPMPTGEDRAMAYKMFPDNVYGMVKKPSFVNIVQLFSLDPLLKRNGGILTVKLGVNLHVTMDVDQVKDFLKRLSKTVSIAFDGFEREIRSKVESDIKTVGAVYQTHVMDYIESSMDSLKGRFVVCSGGEYVLDTEALANLFLIETLYCSADSFYDHIYEGSYLND